MHTFLQQVSAGISTGGIYASVALALVMIYRSTHLINFAQGDMAMFSTYVAWALINAGLPYWLAFTITVAGSFFGGMLIERTLVRPIASADDLTIVIVLIGLQVVLNSVAGWLFSYNAKSFPSPFQADPLFGITWFSPHELGILAVTTVVLVAVFAFFRFTPLGLMMRAAAYNRQSSRLVGINVGRMLGLGWGLAAAIGAVAGILVAPLVYLDPNMMSGILLYGFASALLGGIDNPWGAVLGGFAIGIVENLAGAYVVGTELKLTVALVIIVGVLTLRPNGLFGNTVVRRV